MLLKAMEANADVWIGWTPWDLKGSDGDYRLTNDGSEQPSQGPKHTVDQPAMAWYEPFLHAGAGNPSAPPSTPGGGNVESVYVDSLATGWVDWSFNLTSSKQVGDPARGSKAYEVTFGQNSGFKLAHATGGVEKPLDASAYNALVFYLRAKAASPTLNSLSFRLENGSSSVLISKYATLVPGTWTEVRIPLSEANSSGKPIVNIELNDASGSTIGIDDIGLARAK